MKRAGTATLNRIAPLLAALRAHDALREGRPGHFYLKSREVLHFHNDPSGIFADLRLADGFVRVCVTSSEEQAELLDRLEDCLTTIESRMNKGRRSRKQGRVGDRPFSSFPRQR
jgi:hypothetical protein